MQYRAWRASNHSHSGLLQSDEFATVIHIEYKEDLGDLIELTTAIKNLGLNVVRASVDALAGDDLAVYEFFVTGAQLRPSAACPGRFHQFAFQTHRWTARHQFPAPHVAIFQRSAHPPSSYKLPNPASPRADKNTSDKILKSEMLEEIRMSVAYSLIETHGDMGDKLLSSDVSIYADLDAPIGRPVPRNKDGIKTKVRVTRHATGTRSILRVRTWVSHLLPCFLHRSGPLPGGP